MRDGCVGESKEARRLVSILNYWFVPRVADFISVFLPPNYERSLSKHPRIDCYGGLGNVAHPWSNLSRPDRDACIFETATLHFFLIDLFFPPGGISIPSCQFDRDSDSRVCRAILVHTSVGSQMETRTRATIAAWLVAAV